MPHSSHHPVLTLRADNDPGHSYSPSFHQPHPRPRHPASPLSDLTYRHSLISQHMDSPKRTPRYQASRRDEASPQTVPHPTIQSYPSICPPKPSPPHFPALVPPRFLASSLPSPTNLPLHSETQINDFQLTYRAHPPQPQSRRFYLQPHSTPLAAGAHPRLIYGPKSKTSHSEGNQHPSFRWLACWLAGLVQWID